MRLTDFHRKAFVNAAMNDVPKGDWDEQARALVQKFILNNRLPAQVRGLANDGELREWLALGYYIAPGSLNGVSYYARAGEVNSLLDLKTISPELWEELKKLAVNKNKEKEKLASLSEKLRAVAASATTRKALAGMLPEFEKYLPDEAPPQDRMLPAVANMVADFMRAGWPKDQAKTAAKPAANQKAKSAARREQAVRA